MEQLSIPSENYEARGNRVLGLTIVNVNCFSQVH